jgi:hypothetical protein
MVYTRIEIRELNDVIKWLKQMELDCDDVDLREQYTKSIDVLEAVTDTTTEVEELRDVLDEIESLARRFN